MTGLAVPAEATTQALPNRGGCRGRGIQLFPSKVSPFTPRRGRGGNASIKQGGSPLCFPSTGTPGCSGTQEEERSRAQAQRCRITRLPSLIPERPWALTGPSGPSPGFSPAAPPPAPPVTFPRWRDCRGGCPPAGRRARWRAADAGAAAPPGSGPA